MKHAPGSTKVFARFDLAVEVGREKTRRVSEIDVLQRVADCLASGNETEIESIVERALESRDPQEVIDRGLIPGMREVGRLWDAGVYFLPQVIVSSDAMIAGIALCERKMGKTLRKKAKVVTHTAEGDIHDIGQVIVNALLRAAGFDVIDLGADVPVEEVVEACRTHRPLMLTGTALMTTTMTAFPRIASRLKALDLDIPFVCGGGAVNEEYVTSFDLGVWGKEASQAPAMAEDLLGGLGWAGLRAKWNV
ncbi:MAG: cobalamin-dependent protein [Spirochaetaceae bacterium]|nr:cobalamin-dependent protein [Spirochaetaceae bacterium]